MFASRSILLVTAAVAVIVAISLLDGSRPSKIAAAPYDPFVDSDGDLLPDTLEWVLMCDPLNPDTDGDGIDDFLESAQNQPPFNAAGTTTQIPFDHEMRSVIAYYTTPDGQTHAIFHVLMRIATGNPATLHGITPFIETNGVRVPITRLVGSSVVHVAYRNDPKQGLYVLIASRIAGMAEMNYLLPCGIGLTGFIGSKHFRTGTVLSEVAGTTTAIVAYGNNRFAFLPVDAAQDPSKKFWNRAHVCQLELAPIGGGPTSTICQIIDAGCLGQPTLVCAPDCSQYAGQYYTVPYGIGFLNGN